MEEGGTRYGENHRGGNRKVDLKWRTSEQKKTKGGALVGKLITEKNYNRTVTIQMIRKGWNLDKNEDLEIVEVESNAFMFEFWRKEDYLRILKGRLWSIQGTLLNIQPWKEFVTYKEVNFDLAPFWIQFHDLPLEAMDMENVVTLGAAIGDVMMVENPRRGDLLTRSFLRVRVVVDLKKPLMTSMWTSRPNNESIRIKVRYERLQNFCFKCGRLGHDQRTCVIADEENEEEDNVFGNWVSVQAARPIIELINCYKERWEEYEGIEGRNKKLKRRLEGSNKEGKEKGEYKDKAESS